MSLYSAMYAGVSALQSQSSAMAAIGDNIANVSTIGYKDTSVSFATLVTKQTSSTSYSSGGVMAKSTQNVATQGSLTATTSSTDIALSGSGFFVVNTSPNPSSSQGLMCYTRSGSFSVDEDGYLVNDSGYYLMGWPLQKANGTEPSTSQITVSGELYARSYTKDDGSTYYVNINVVDNNELQSLNINELGGTAEATLNISLGANLPADNAVGTVVETTASVYDALGITHNIDWAWTKSAANNWDLSMTPAAGSATITALNENSTSTGSNAYFAAGQLEFTGTWDPTSTVSDIDGISFTVDYYDSTNTLSQSVVYTLDSSTLMAASATAAGVGTIGIGDATSWSDVTSTIATLLNSDDAATSGFNAATGPASRFAASSTGYSVIATQSGSAGQLVIGDFVDGTAGGVLDEYLVTVGAVTSAQPTFTITQLDQSNGNYAGATNFTIDTGLDKTLAVPAAYDGMTFVFDGITYELDSDASGASGTNTAVGIAAAATWDDIATAIAAQIETTDPKTALVTYTAAGGVITGTLAGQVTDLSGMVFNGDGTPQTINVTDMEVTWANGAENMTGDNKVNLFFGNANLTDGITQLSSPYQVNYLTQDGAKFGNFAGVEISADGVVTALYDNGVRTPIFQIPVATFVNDNGLESLTGNAWIQTDISGSYTLHIAGSAGAGDVNAAALESSTVDLSTEFTNMIVTQRAYSAASKVITTANQMMDDLLAIIR